jgi:hypothetical protein
MIMLVTALLSAFLSSTGTVAVMLPVVLAIARRRGISPSQPADAAGFRGPAGRDADPDRHAAEPDRQHPARAGRSGRIRFLQLSPRQAWFCCWSGSAAWYCWCRGCCPSGADRSEGRILPPWSELLTQYGLKDRQWRLRVPPGSTLAATDITSTELRTRYGVTVLAIVSHTARGRFVRKAEPGSVIRDYDELHVIGLESNLRRMLVRPEPNCWRRAPGYPNRSNWLMRWCRRARVLSIAACASCACTAVPA